MNPYFAEWYREARLDPKDEFLRNRWDVVAKAVAGVSANQIPSLVRMFYQKPQKDETVRQGFVSAFQTADVTFRIVDNDVEIAVLAGGVLAEVLTKPGLISDFAATALVAPNCESLGARPPVAAIVNQARQYLMDRAVSVRASTEPALPVSAKFDKQITQLKEAANSGNVTQTGEITATIVKLLVAADAAVSERIALMQQRVALFREESDILWWLAGRYSRDLNCALSDLDLSSACLVIGRDLAELTTSPVGPYGAHAFMDRAIKENFDELPNEVSIVGAVKATDPEWRLRTVSRVRADIDDLCPITLGLRQLTELGSRWTTAFGKATSVSPTAKLTPVRLANQMYNEVILGRIASAISQ